MKNSLSPYACQVCMKSGSWIFYYLSLKFPGKSRMAPSTLDEWKLGNAGFNMP